MQEGIKMNEGRFQRLLKVLRNISKDLQVQLQRKNFLLGNPFSIALIIQVKSIYKSAFAGLITVVRSSTMLIMYIPTTMVLTHAFEFQSLRQCR